MMTFENYQIIKPRIHSYLIESGVQRKLKVSDSLLDGIEDHLLAKIQFKEYYTKSLAYYILGYLLGLLYCFINKLFIFRYRGNKAATRKKIIFISARTLYNRFLNLSAEIDNSGVVYMPDITFDYLNNHLKEHKIKKNDVYVMTYSLVDMILIIISSVKLLPLFVRLNRKLNLYNDFSEFYIDRLVTVFCLKFVSGTIGIRHYFYADNSVFISDYDKSIDLLVLKHHREQFKLNYKIGSLNHGAFVGFNLSYVRPNADFVMCTCMREEITVKKYSNIDIFNIKAVGAPLQSFSDTGDLESHKENKGTYLVLGTLAEGVWLKMQRDLISVLKKANVSFKYRPRPASKDKDLLSLRDVLSEKDCTHNTTLSQDCANYTNIISFSLDALNSCIRLTRNIVVYVTEQVFQNFSPIGESSNQIVITSSLSDIITFVNTNQDESDYNENTKKWIINNIGEQDFSKVVGNIKQFIEQNS